MITSTAPPIALDKDPPFARLDFNYDPFTATPLARNVKVAISQKL